MSGDPGVAANSGPTSLDSLFGLFPPRGDDGDLDSLPEFAEDVDPQYRCYLCDVVLRHPRLTPYIHHIHIRQICAACLTRNGFHCPADEEDCQDMTVDQNHVKNDCKFSPKDCGATATDPPSLLRRRLEESERQRLIVDEQAEKSRRTHESEIALLKVQNSMFEEDFKSERRAREATSVTSDRVRDELTAAQAQDVYQAALQRSKSLEHLQRYKQLEDEWWDHKVFECEMLKRRQIWLEREILECEMFECRRRCLEHEMLECCRRLEKLKCQLALFGPQLSDWLKKKAYNALSATRSAVDCVVTRMWSRDMAFLSLICVLGLLGDPERAVMLAKNGKQPPPFDLSLSSAQLDMKLLHQQMISHGWADDTRRRPPLEDHVTRLRQLYVPLSKKLVAVSLAEDMFQRNDLSLDQLETIQRLHDSPSDAARQLMNILMRSPREKCYSFLDALRRTNQMEAYTWLIDTVKGAEVETEHDSRTSWIRSNYTNLLHELDTKYSDLLDELYSTHVLDSDEYDAIISEVTLKRRNERLLSFMLRKSQLQMNAFFHALDQTGQGYLTDHVTRHQHGFASSIGIPSSFSMPPGRGCL